MTCWICDWFQRRLGFRAEIDCDRVWANVDAWESACSNDSELWAAESDPNLDLIEQAAAIQDSDPEAAFHLYLRAADAGSIWGMRMVAWHYHLGSFVEPDHALAQDYYHRAICAGSWMATIPYARLLAEHGHFDACERILQDGIREDFLPAYFWLASIRFKQSRSRKTCREIRPLLEHASGKGHPGAKRLLAGLQLFGKYGLRQMPKGFRMLRECMQEDIQRVRQAEAAAGDTVARDRGYGSVDAADPRSPRRAAVPRPSASL